MGERVQHIGTFYFIRQWRVYYKNLVCQSRNLSGCGGGGEGKVNITDSGPNTSWTGPRLTLMQCPTHNYISIMLTGTILDRIRSK